MECSLLTYYSLSVLILLCNSECVCMMCFKDFYPLPQKTDVLYRDSLIVRYIMSYQGSFVCLLLNVCVLISFCISYTSSYCFKMQGSTNLESIQIIKKPGGSLKDSFLDEG